MMSRWLVPLVGGGGVWAAIEWVVAGILHIQRVSQPEVGCAALAAGLTVLLYVRVLDPLNRHIDEENKARKAGALDAGR